MQYQHPPHRWLKVLAAFPVLLGLAAAAEGVTISGIMVYSTDDFGNPNGVNTQITGKFDAHMWRTLVRPSEIWHGLAVTQGLPPRSIDDKFLNLPNFVVDLPLDEGENYFTLFGEPGPLTLTDDYQRFAVNLYFDGDETNPAISVLFPRFADLEGAAVAPSRANEGDVYSLAALQVPAKPQTYYDDGVYRVSVLEASFLPPERAGLSVDRIGAHSLTSGGASDWVGTLTVLVEPSENFGPGGGAPIPAAGGGGGGGGRGSGGGLGGGVPAGSGGPYVPPGAIGVPGAGDAGDSGVVENRPDRAGTDGDFWHEGDKVEDSEVDEEVEDPEGTRTPEDLVNALQRWLAAANEATPEPEDEHADATPGETPAPTATAGLETPTAEAEATPTVEGTAVESSTPASTETSAAPPTPTPEKPGAPQSPREGG